MSQLKILAPLDHSSRDRILLPHLKRISEATGATIHLLQVISGIKALEPQAARAAESYVDACESQLQAHGVDAHGIVRKGDPAEEIVKVADEYQVDAIIMGTRGRRGLKRAVLGSVADEVMNHCRYPVTLVNEAMAGDALDETVWTQSSYMAGTIWNQVARGLISEEQAQAELQRLEAMGLDHDVLTHTYSTLKESGAPAHWLDLEFQRDTLEQYAPDDAPQQDKPAA
jgi:nucleotide-binding universal stress UspA family protein